MPHASVLYSVDGGFSLLVTYHECGRWDNFRAEDVVYRLSDCCIQKVDAKDVVIVPDERENWDLVQIICEIECSVVFIGAPWAVEFTN